MSWILHRIASRGEKKKKERAFNFGGIFGIG